MRIWDNYIELPTTLPALDVNTIYFVLFALLVFCMSRPFKSLLRPYILLIANLFFLYTFSVNGLYVACCLAMMAYIFGLLLGKFKNKILLFFAVLCFAGTLLTYKYNGIIELSLVMPIGLSFYTFKAISYVVDVYKGKMKSEKNPIFFFDYLLFFPCITAGPINRAEEFLNELRAKRPFSYEEYKASKGGAFQMLLGIYEKKVFADFIYSVIERCLNVEGITGSNALFGVVLYAVYIYLDFDAISNIAIGCTRLLGFTIPKNFNSPYLARTLKEFWERWHISLSCWLKDYIYIPLGGGRKGLVLKYVNILVVFAISGLWHGNTWNFLLWGILHAVVRIIEDLLLYPFKGKKINVVIKWVASVFGIVLNFAIVTFLWLFFKYQTVEEVMEVVRTVQIAQPFSYQLIGLTRNEYWWLLTILVIVVVLDILRSQVDMIMLFNHLFSAFRWIIYTVLIISFMVFAMYGGTFEAADFIYKFF